MRMPQRGMDRWFLVAFGCLLVTCCIIYFVVLGNQNPFSTIIAVILLISGMMLVILSFVDFFKRERTAGRPGSGEPGSGRPDIDLEKAKRATAADAYRWMSVVESLVFLIVVVVINRLLHSDRYGYIGTFPHPFWPRLLLT